MENKEKSKVPALEKTIEILDLIKTNNECFIKDFLKETAISRSSLYTLLNEMVKFKLIKQKENGAYCLWVKVIEFGNAASEHLDLTILVRPYLNKLIKETDCLSAYFGLLDNDSAYYLEKISNKNKNIKTKSIAGASIDFVHSGMGKCLLAFMDTEAQEKILPSLNYHQITNKSLKTKNDLLKDLSEIKSRGWAFNDSEDDESIRSIAVPVLTKDVQIFGAISIVGTIKQFSNAKINKFANLAKGYANLISKELFL